MAAPDSAPLGQERRVLTLLFADLSGSTALGERLDPEQLRQVLDRYFAAMREEIEAEGGTVEKFIGDAVVAGFGTPVAHEDDAARALRAALRMRARLPAVNAELDSLHGVTLEIRIGVNTGEVLATLDPLPGEPMFTGDAVNTAARFEQHARPGQILASERTVRAARGFATADAGLIEMKGKAEPARAFEVLGEDGSAPARGVPGLSAPMVGRDAELELLASMAARVSIERRPHLVTIYGEPGVGKSRLTQEFLTSATHGTTVRGRCLPYGDGVTYWPLAEILKGVAGVLDSDPPKLALDRVHALGRSLLGADEVATRATAALAFTMGLDDPMVRFGETDPKQVNEEIGQAWRAFFGALAHEAPVLALIEDIHWADPALLDLLERLAEEIEGPVLFLCPARPELLGSRPNWGGGKRNYSGLSLDPLTTDEAEDLMRALLNIDDLPASVHGQILERAGGNPFFLEEIVRQLADGGHVVREGERWRATGDVAAVEIPDTVQAVLAARIDMLETAPRGALQAAAVVGRVFWPGAVRRLVRDRDGLEEAFAPLQARDLIRARPASALAGETEYIFKHVLTRDVAYETLPRAERAVAHAAVAAWLEESVGDRSSEFLELLAYHYTEAHRAGRESATADVDLVRLRERAFDLNLRAAEAARARLALHRAERYASQSLDLAADAEERSLAGESLAEAYFEGYQGTEAWEAYERAIDGALEASTPNDLRIARLCARAVAVPTRWPGSMYRTPPEEDVGRLMEIGIAHLPPGDSLERIHLLSIRSSWPFAFPWLEITDEERDALIASGIEAAESALRMGLPDLASAAFDNAAGPALVAGRYDVSSEIENRRLGLIDQLRDPLEIGDTYGMLSWCGVSAGRFAQGVAFAEEGLRVTRGASASSPVHLLSWLAYAHFGLGAWEEALAAYGELSDLLGDQRDDPPYFASGAYGAAGMIHHLRGEVAEADRLLDSLKRVSDSAGSGRGSIRPWTSAMPLMVARGELEGARARMVDRVPGWQVHGDTLFEAAGAWVAAAEAWDRAPSLIEEMRTFAIGGCRPAAWHADLLEGRWQAAAERPTDAVAAFDRARTAFASAGAVRDAAICDLEVARVVGLGALDPDRQRRLDEATVLFERLRSVRDLDRVRAL